MVQALTHLKHADLAAQVNLRVARKVLDAQKMEGAAALKLLEAAAPPVSRAGDALVAAATGLGAVLDLRA